MTAHTKIRADQLVHEQGLSESREQAKRLIMAGQVQVMPKEGSKALPVRVDKPGHMFPRDTVFALTGQEQYVSRGAYKLLTILEDASLDVTGYVCLDAGASTGGFTDCLLQPAEFAEIVRVFRTFLEEFDISVYNADTHEGLVRHLYLRKGFVSGEIMVCVVINGGVLPQEPAVEPPAGARLCPGAGRGAVVQRLHRHQPQPHHRLPGGLPPEGGPDRRRI